MQPLPPCRRRITLLTCALLPLTALLSLSPADGWFTDPCQYHPHALQQLRLRFDSIVGQQYATDTIYAHMQRHFEQYESSRLQKDAEASITPHKPLVLSFHGPTGTGKSLTANSIASALFHQPRSSHIHTYHGGDYSGTSPAQVAESVSFLKSEFAAHVRRCPLALFIIEEIHMMAPGVLDSLRHLMDAQAPNSRFRIGKGELLQREPAQGQPQEEAGSTPSKDSINDVDGGAGAHSAAASRSAAGASAAAAAPTSSSIALNFAHVVWLFTTNIGSQQVQKVAYDAAKAGLPRESLSPHHLHDMLLASLDHTSQLALLRDSSVLSALIPFFPLFKAHVKECARVQLEHRKKYWLQNAQVSAFDWDASVPAYAASQLKYSGPISVYGCKNVHEILTTTLLAPLTRQFRKEQEEHDHALSETLRDARVPKRKKLFDWMSNALAHVRQVWTGPVWNFGRTKVEVRIEEKGDAGETGAGGGGGGGEEVVFSFEEDREAGEDGDPNPHVKRSEFRHPLYPQAGKYHDIPKQRAPTQHATLMENTPEAPKDEL